MKIAVARTGYFGLSIAMLISQNHQVIAIDIVPEKVALLNNKKAPIKIWKSKISYLINCSISK